MKTVKDLRSYYDSKGITIPAELLPREIELYERLSEDNLLVSEAYEELDRRLETKNQKLVEIEKKLKSSRIKDYGIVIASSLIGLGVFFGITFVQESQRNKELLRQVDSLKASEMVQENSQLKDEIEKLNSQVEEFKQEKQEEEWKFYLIVAGSGCIGILIGISGTFLLMYFKN